MKNKFPLKIKHFVCIISYPFLLFIDRITQHNRYNNTFLLFSVLVFILLLGWLMYKERVDKTHNDSKSKLDSYIFFFMFFIAILLGEFVKYLFR